MIDWISPKQQQMYATFIKPNKICTEWIFPKFYGKEWVLLIFDKESWTADVFTHITSAEIPQNNFSCQNESIENE